MSDLKKQLIKLGSTNPELRPHIRKILSSWTRGQIIKHITKILERTRPTSTDRQSLVKLLADTLSADEAFRNFVIAYGTKYLGDDVIEDPIYDWGSVWGISAHEMGLRYDVEKLIQVAAKKWEATNSKWEYDSSPKWETTSGMYGSSGVYAEIKYTPKPTRDLRQQAEADFKKRAIPVGEAVVKGFKERAKFVAGISSNDGGFYTQAFWMKVR